MHRLTAWANDGVDIHAKLPSLSAYLGHQNIIGTEVYLGRRLSFLNWPATVRAAPARCAPASNEQRAPRELFALVESFFIEYLPRQRGASRHTVRAYRDALKLLFEFAAQRSARQIASLELGDLDADTIAEFLDHIEATRSNSVATRNCRRAALRSFFKHLVRNDLAHSLQYTRVLAIPSKKARQRPATYLEADAPGGRNMRPSLTAAARHGPIILRVGAEEWLRQGPEQRMSRKPKPTCRQIR